MASTRALLFLALCLSVGSLTTFANHNNSFIFIIVHTFLFFLLPFTFISAIILLIIHVATPLSAYIKCLTMATRALASATILLGTVLMLIFTLTAEAVPDTIKAAVIVMALVIAHISFAKSFNLPNYPANGFVPVFFALCNSTGTLLLNYQIMSFSYRDHTNSLSNILIHLLLFFNFILAMALLFLHASVTPVGPGRLISAVMIERLVKTTVAMSLTAVLIGMYMHDGGSTGWN